MKRTLLIVGGILLIMGILGLFVRITQDDGALLIAGSVLCSAGVLARS